MSSPPTSRRRYHHGDLPAALRASAMALVAERGPHGFSLAEAARRAGVTTAAPYRHYADREALLAALAVEAYDALADQLRAAGRAVSGMGTAGPAARLAEMAGAYVRFADERRAQFQVLFGAGVDKHRHPEVAAAGDRALAVVTELVAQVPDAPASLAVDLWAVAHGYASLLLDGAFTDLPQPGPTAVANATSAATTLIKGGR